MTRLTATAQQVIRALERQGWRLDHTRGSHHYYRHPTKPGMVSVPCHKGTSLKPKTLSSILDGAGISREDFFKLRWRRLPEVRDVLRALRPLHATEDSYVFVNAKNGGPIEQSEWPKDHWRRAVTATKVRPRKFYATKHTFISVALTKGLNLSFNAEYCGTSVAMIEQNYGRFLASRVDDQLRLLSGNSDATQVGRRVAKTATFGGGLQFSAEKPLWNKASPTVASWKQPKRDLLGNTSSSGCVKWSSCGRQWQREAHRWLNDDCASDAAEKAEPLQAL